LYAAMVALPVALPVGLTASISATAFGYLVGRRQPLWVWVLTFAAAGAIFGVLCASPLIIACVGQDEIGLARVWVLRGGFSGVALMALLSTLWFPFFHER
jgi:hypothetical protein